MNILIVGCGKVGQTIGKLLSLEKYNNIVMMDIKSQPFERIVESSDVLTIKGNGLTRQALMQASIKTMDLVICVTNSDETNILCCVTAKKLGAKKAAARVRDPEYFRELYDLRKDLGVDLIINPEQIAALEISRLLRFPQVSEIDTFAGGKVEMVSFKITNESILSNTQVSQSFYKIKIPVLAAQIQRENNFIIPNGQTVILPGDILRILGRPVHIMEFFSHLGIKTGKSKDVIIIGGGKVTYYLAGFLENHKIDMKIIEIDEEQCIKMNEDLPSAMIINGDGTDEDLLKSEGILNTGAVVCLTDRDEENVVMGLYAKQCNVPKTIIKINHININLVKQLDMGSVVCPKNATAYQIIRYVRGLSNAKGVSSIKSIHRIADFEDDYVEALEFEVNSLSKLINKQLKDLHIKKNVLVGCVVRARNVFVASGTTAFEEGDVVIIITKSEKILVLEDIISSDIL